MRISKLTWICWSILFGCGGEAASTNGGTVATEVSGGPSGQPQEFMKVIPRSACVAMCDNARSCGGIDAGALGNCMGSCDSAAAWLDQVDPNASVDLAWIGACFVASSCAGERPPKCQPSDIALLARTFDPEGLWQTTWPNVGYTTVGATSCLEESELHEFAPDEWKVSCQSFIKQSANPDRIWGVTCDRRDTANDWTCSCWESGVEVQTGVTGAVRPSDPGMLRICWPAARLTCFYAGNPDC
jgi:hypothetical protein